MIKFFTFLSLFIVVFLLGQPTVFAADADADNESPIDIMGTVADHDYFTFFGTKLYLPRLFLWQDVNGSTHFSTYGSTKKALASGEFEQVEYVITPVNGSMLIDFSLTSHLLYFWFGLGALALFTMYAGSRYKKGIGTSTAPKGVLQNLFEIFYEFIRDEVAKPNIEGEKYKKYVPYLFTMFMSIAFMNSFGLLPWAATATADITVTAVLALFTFFVTQFSGTKDHWQHVFWFPGVPLGVKFLMIPVELIGLLTKPFALAIR